MSPQGNLTVTEVAARCQVTAGTIYAWLRQGIAPPHFRLPTGRLRFPEVDLERWLAERHQGGDAA
jgi:excisionase family DNA binding protein